MLNAIVNLSNFIAANSDKVDQVEMNPILVSETEVIALDALIIKNKTGDKMPENLTGSVGQHSNLMIFIRW